jgi:hypothetical protein
VPRGRAAVVRDDLLDGGSKMRFLPFLIGDGRELVLQRQTIRAAHESTARPSPDEIAAHYVIDERCVEPTPSVIGVFDDLLTTGAHFVAIKRILSERFPGVPVLGLFVVRRVPQDE